MRARSSFAHVVRWHRPLVAFSPAMVATAAVCAVGLVVDDRVVVGEPVWFKPLKFSVSFGIYALTLAWMLSLLTRRTRVGWWTGTVPALAGTIEMVIIVWQAARGRRSHFNEETPFDANLAAVTGQTVVVLWLAALLIAVLLLRQRATDPAVMSAVRLGSFLAVAGLALGVLMVMQAQEPESGGIPAAVAVHSVGVPDGGPSMPLTGWSTTGGDLRIPHFVGMHALQAIPLVALGLGAASRRVPRLRTAGTRRRLVRVAAGTHAALVALVTWQALRGQPLIHPDGATLLALAAIGAVSSAAVVAVLHGTGSGRPVPSAAEQVPVA